MARTSKDTEPKGSIFGSTVGNLRNSLGLTQEQFALYIGTSPSLISRMESGEKPPPNTLRMVNRFYSGLEKIPGIKPEDIDLIKQAGQMQTLANNAAPASKHSLFSPVEGIKVLVMTQDNSLNSDELEILKREIALSTRAIIHRREERQLRIDSDLK